MRSAGVYRYAEECSIILTAYAINNGEVKVIEGPPSKFHQELWSHLCDRNCRIYAHNAMFDRVVLKTQGCPTELDRWRCTSSIALAHGFPGGLDSLSRILKCDTVKSRSGQKLIGIFSRDNGQPVNFSGPAWEEFKQYAADDVKAMRQAAHRMPHRNNDWPLYHLDQKINDRGFRVDLELCRGAESLTAEIQLDLQDRLQQITQGMVAKPSQRARFVSWLEQATGLPVKDSKEATLRAFMAAHDLPSYAGEAIELVIEYNRSSTKKYTRMLECVSSDGRFRGGLRYCGASRTRRWTGNTFVPINLPSKGLASQRDIDMFIKSLKAGAAAVTHDNLIKWCSDSLRSLLIPEQNHKLAVCDLSNIEGRIIAWLAGERWKLQAFGDFDQGRGPDLYKLTAGRILGINPARVDKSQRQAFGKVPELALGYQGGVGAMHSTCSLYGMKMRDYKDQLLAHHPEETRADIREFVEKYHSDLKIPETEKIACEALKRMWRDSNQNIVGLWGKCSVAAERALMDNERVYKAGRLFFRRRTHGETSFLEMVLPTGRSCFYCNPSTDGEGLRFEGVNPLTKQWGGRRIYGGMLVENACQSIARDVMAAHMADVERAGYRILLLVHDEIVTETRSGTAEELSAIITQPIQGLEGLPLHAGGYEALSYRKV